MSNLVGMDASAAPRLLPPTAATVIELAERLHHNAAPGLLPCLRRDPGAWAMTLQICGELGPRRWDLHQPAQLTKRLLEDGTKAAASGFACWSSPQARLTYQAALATARLAERLAPAHNLDADEAFSLGYMAWLGALVQALPGLAESCDDLKPNVLTRRLARRWQWPMWLLKALQKLDALPGLTEANSPETRRGWVVQAALEAVQRLLPWPSERAWPFTERDAMARLGITFESIQPWAPELIEAHPPASVGIEAAPLILRVSARLADQEFARSEWLLARCEEEIDELRQQLQDFRQQRDEQLQMLKLEALAEFAAGASHEINNPLAVISAQAQHLLKTEESLERAKALERIIAQSRRIHVLLRDVMMFARPPEPHFRGVQAERLIRQVLQQQAELADEREVKLEGPRGQKRNSIKGDAELIVTALNCLVRNALEAAPAGGWVKVSVAAADRSHVLFVVEDNGPGLPPSMRWQLFDPFFSGRSAGRGIGMGLPKVWRIAQLHGGSIQWTSTPGQPTRFELRLPIQPAHALPTSKRSATLHPKMAARHIKPRRKRAS